MHEFNILHGEVS